MNIIKMLVVAILFAFFVFPAYADSPKMFFGEFRFVTQKGDDIKETTKVWRIGYRYLRIEGPLEQMLVISNAPDTYIIDESKKLGKHILDTSKNIDVHAPVFAQFSQEGDELEIGHETTFFDKHHAALIATKMIEGIKCNVYNTTVNGTKLTLYKRYDNGNPLQVGIEKGDTVYDIRYIRYETEITPDLKLFEVPSGIKLVDAD